MYYQCSKHVWASRLKNCPITPFNTIYIKSVYCKHCESYLWHYSHFCHGHAHHMIRCLVLLLLHYIESSPYHRHCKIILYDSKSLDDFILVWDFTQRARLLGSAGKGRIKNIVWLFAKTFPCGEGLDGLCAFGLNLHTVQLIMACLLVERGEVPPQNFSSSFLHVPSRRGLV